MLEFPLPHPGEEQDGEGPPLPGAARGEEPPEFVGGHEFGEALLGKPEALDVLGGIQEEVVLPDGPPENGAEALELVVGGSLGHGAPEPLAPEPAVLGVDVGRRRDAPTMELGAEPLLALPIGGALADRLGDLAGSPLKEVLG